MALLLFIDTQMPPIQPIGADFYFPHGSFPAQSLKFIAQSKNIIAHNLKLLAFTDTVLAFCDIILAFTDNILAPSKKFLAFCDIILAPSEEFLAFCDNVLAPSKEFLTFCDIILAPSKEFLAFRENVLAPSKEFLAFCDNVLARSEEFLAFCDKMAALRINGLMMIAEDEAKTEGCAAFQGSDGINHKRDHLKYALYKTLLSGVVTVSRGQLSTCRLNTSALRLPDAYFQARNFQIPLKTLQLPACRKGTVANASV
jgi:hypothetical protein